MSPPALDEPPARRPAKHVEQSAGKSGLSLRFHRVAVVGYETVMSALFSLPRFRSANALKAWFLRRRGAEIGARVDFYPGSWITPGHSLVLGDDVDVSKDVIITTAGGVRVGDRTMIGFRSQVLSRNHAVPENRGPIFGAGYTQAPVTIGADCWIGANVVVLPGVTIGDGAVVAANSVVTRDVAAWTLVAGAPAQAISFRPPSGPVRPIEARRDATEQTERTLP